MRVAIIGTRNLAVNISKYIAVNVTEIVSGGARGIDRLAEQWADTQGIPKLIIKPDYAQYGKGAPLRRNELIVDAADIVVAVWDGKSKGTQFAIEYAQKIGKSVTIYMVE